MNKNIYIVGTPLVIHNGGDIVAISSQARFRARVTASSETPPTQEATVVYSPQYNFSSLNPEQRKAKAIELQQQEKAYKRSAEYLDYALQQANEREDKQRKKGYAATDPEQYQRVIQARKQLAESKAAWDSSKASFEGSYGVSASSVASAYGKKQYNTGNVPAGQGMSGGVQGGYTGIKGAAGDPRVQTISGKQYMITVSTPTKNYEQRAAEQRTAAFQQKSQERAINLALNAPRMIEYGKQKLIQQDEQKRRENAAEVQRRVFEAIRVSQGLKKREESKPTLLTGAKILGEKLYTYGREQEAKRLQAKTPFEEAKYSVGTSLLYPAYALGSVARVGENPVGAAKTLGVSAATAFGIEGGIKYVGTKYGATQFGKSTLGKAVGVGSGYVAGGLLVGAYSKEVYGRFEKAGKITDPIQRYRAQTGAFSETGLETVGFYGGAKAFNAVTTPKEFVTASGGFRYNPQNFRSKEGLPFVETYRTPKGTAGPFNVKYFAGEFKSDVLKVDSLLPQGRKGQTDIGGAQLGGTYGPFEFYATKGRKLSKGELRQQSTTGITKAEANRPFKVSINQQKSSSGYVVAELRGRGRFMKSYDRPTEITIIAKDGKTKPYVTGVTPVGFDPPRIEPKRGKEQLYTLKQVSKSSRSTVVKESTIDVGNKQMTVLSKQFVFNKIVPTTKEYATTGPSEVALMRPSSSVVGYRNMLPRVKSGQYMTTDYAGFSDVARPQRTSNLGSPEDRRGRALERLRSLRSSYGYDSKKQYLPSVIPNYGSGVVTYNRGRRSPVVMDFSQRNVGVGSKPSVSLRERSLGRSDISIRNEFKFRESYRPATISRAGYAVNNVQVQQPRYKFDLVQETKPSTINELEFTKPREISPTPKKPELPLRRQPPRVPEYITPRFSIEITRDPFRPFTPSKITPAPPAPYLRSGGEGYEYNFKRLGKNKLRYTPSLYAIGTGVKGKATKGGVFSGLAVRGI